MRKFLPSITAAFLAVKLLFMPTLADYPAERKTAYSAAVPLGTGLTYERNIDYHPVYGPQREYIFHYTPNDETTMTFASTPYLCGTATVSSLAAINEPDRRFAGGINADFFNMNTGVPESGYIKNGELYTSDRGMPMLAARSDESYFIDRAGISLTLQGENEAILPVAHLNKEFSEYGFYLYNARYAAKTGIKSAHTAITLAAYTDKQSFAELFEVYRNEELEKLYEEAQNAEKRKEASLKAYEEAKAAAEEALDREENSTETEENEQEAEISRDVTLPALAEAVKTDTEAAEALQKALISTLETRSGYRKCGENFYLIEPVCPQIGKQEKLVALAADRGVTNETIPESRYLLCGDDRSYGKQLAAYTEGSEWTFTVSGAEAFADVVDAIGTGHIIVSDGKAIDEQSLSHYTSAQPRSAVGIKADGSLVVYAVDGRQAGFSAGLKILSLAERMVELGCVSAANLDGGGSTAVHAFLPGTTGSMTVNKPSGGSERKVANALLFTDTKEPTGQAAAAYLYDDHLVTYADHPVKIGSLYPADGNGFSAKLSEGSSVLLDTHGVGRLDGNVFDPCGETGVIPLYASVDGGETENLAGTVVSVEEPDRILLSVSPKLLTPFDSATVKVGSVYRGLAVTADESRYLWSIAVDGKETPTIVLPAEEEGAYRIVNEYSVIENGVLTPLVYGKTLSVKATRGNVSAPADVKVLPYPFVDMDGHWARREVYDLHALGVVEGEYDAQGRAYYFPERTYSRAEFCTMLARLTGLTAELPRLNEQSAPVEEAEGVDEETDPPESFFEDEDEIPEWAYLHVIGLYEAGLLKKFVRYDENGKAVFDGDSAVTRGEVMEVMGRLCADAGQETAVYFPDLPDDENARKAVAAGIFGGYEDGTLRPENALTRAEGAAVFTRYGKVK